jgi:hypothetical protein
MAYLLKKKLDENTYSIIISYLKSWIHYKDCLIILSEPYTKHPLFSNIGKLTNVKNGNGKNGNVKNGNGDRAFLSNTDRKQSGYYETVYDNNIFKNIGYYGYSFFLGLIDLKKYFHIRGSISLYIIFDIINDKIKLMEIVTMNYSKLLHKYKISENKCIGGVFNKGLYGSFYFDINNLDNLTSIEKQNWYTLIQNITNTIEKYKINGNNDITINNLPTLLFE